MDKLDSSNYTGSSLLAVDVGEINTRAALFDVVEGRYRFLAVGTARTTATAPFNHIGEGISRAINDLEQITDRDLIGDDDRLIIPSKLDGTGIDMFTATISAGPPLRVIAVGLLEDISLASAQRLTSTIYAEVVETLGLNDRKTPEERLDTILKLRPDLIVIAGGTDSGASNSVNRLLESVGLACSLMSADLRPEVLFAGNQALNSTVENRLSNLTKHYFAPNVRPSLEVEQISPAQHHMVDIFRSIRASQIPGVSDLDEWTGMRLMPTSSAFGRMIQFLSKVYDPSKGVLGIDVGASATTIAAAFDGELNLGVYPQYGLGRGITGLMEDPSMNEFLRWIPMEVDPDYIRDYIYNKEIYPASLPVSPEDLAIEQSLARQAIRKAISTAESGFSKKIYRSARGMLPWFEPIVATGSVLTRAPSVGHSLLTLLDATQPTSITTFVLDQHNLAAPIGAAAAINPYLSVQVLESSAFLNLATVITPMASVRAGTPILRLKVVYESGDETSLEIKQGTLEALPIPMGEAAKIRLQPLHRSDVGMGGSGRGGSVRVVGGILGVIIDARGRPTPLPKDLGRRRDLYKKWLWTLGG
ncbi:MAG: glutamate mutase L [Anaerolineales bacterium]